jgi:hypothetical protein
MSATDLQNYVGAPESDATYVEACYEEATELVTAFVGSSEPVIAIPDNVLERAILETGSELYHRRQAPNGISQFASLDGTPIRIARDPMTGAYPILQRYVQLGMA